MPLTNAQLKTWHAKIQQARCEDQASLRRQLQGVATAKDSKQTGKFTKRLQNSLQRVIDFKAIEHKITFPEELPISQRRQEIAELIQNNQIIIVAGETGSGKTTQLPKICLSLGYGARGLVGHTQPRRIATRTVADRIASELKTTLGETVGYQVRFKDESSSKTQVKLMTDGILLAEIQNDRRLSRYEVLIIDEAHERSLNIDLLLGLLKPLCADRPDLKVIITSATIDLDKFSSHFAVNGKPAPIIEVSGRTYPIEVLYQPPVETKAGSRTDLPDTIVATVEQIIGNEAKGKFRANGDVLVFCAGEYDIRAAALALRRAQLPIVVLPLYARLSIAEQNKVFRPAQRRKVVLATNVAETSITLPGIAYVIDPGLARISRYSFRAKVQRLPIEAISQASARQRMGRCGRVANGVCIRLYSEEDYLARAEYTPAEILRSNLASVILQMLSLGLRDIANFDFIDQPDTRLLNDGFKLLQELGAIDQRRAITGIGRQLSALPIDPRYARILVEASQQGCLRDALVLIGALSIQDPRERPADQQQAADLKHRALHHPASDFFSYLYLWQAIADARSELSNTKFKQYCQQQFWSVARIFEWRELVRQLQHTCRQLGWNISGWQQLKLPGIDASDRNKANPVDNKPGLDERYQHLHKALLSGLLSNVASKDTDGQYLATRSRPVHIFPGSSQSKRKPRWLVAAEFIETSRLFAHTVAEVKPDWIATAAGDLCRYSYSDPHYHAHSGRVQAWRKTLLYGLTLEERKRVNYETVDSLESRRIFITQALVGGQYQPREIKGSFIEHNSNLIKDIEKLETKVRKRNLLVSEQSIYQFYDDRIPAEIVSRASFDKWRKRAERQNPNLLKLEREQLLVNELDQDTQAQFPDHIDVNGKSIAVSYNFNPGSKRDGVTLDIPIAILALFPLYLGDWLVPGLLREKCIALIKTLPKQIRRNYAPAANAVDRVIARLQPQNTSLQQALGEQLYRLRRVKIDNDAWAPDKLDGYYKMKYRLLNSDGTVLDEGDDLATLQARYAASVRQNMQAEHAPERIKFEQQDISEWNFGDLPKEVNYQHDGMTVRAFPMLKIVADGSISLLLSSSSELANYHSRLALVRLARNQLGSGVQRQSLKYLRKELLKTDANNSKRSLSQLASQLKLVSPLAGERLIWQEELIDAALWTSCFADAALPIRAQSEFYARLDAGGKNWVRNAVEMETALTAALDFRDQLFHAMNAIDSSDIATDSILEDIKAQLYRLFEPAFLRYTSLVQLKQYPRYLRAIEGRLERLADTHTPSPTPAALGSFQQNLAAALETACDAVEPHQLADAESANTPKLGVDFVYLSKPAYLEFAIMLEEWRVSLFAQHLKTRYPVSEKRLARAWQALSS